MKLNTEMIFKEMLQHFNKEVAKDVYAIYQFQIYGNFRETYSLKIKDGQCLLDRENTDSPSLTVNISDRYWFGICEGYLTSKEAFVDGQLKLLGDIDMAIKIAKLFNISEEKVE